jgi:hypothetical protein
LILLIFYNIYSLFSNRKLKLKTLLYSFVFLVGLGFVVYEFWYIISIVLEQRLFERNLASEDYDYPIKQFLSLNPEYLIFGLGGGNAHNFSAPYIAPENLHYMYHRIFVAKSGYLRIISETGITGMFLFLIFNFVMIYRLQKIKYTNALQKNLHNVLIVLLIVSLLSYLARGYALYVYIFVLATINAYLFKQNVKKYAIDTRLGVYNT